MIPVFITARTNSTRLPRKHFLDLGGMTTIEHVVRRAEHFGFKPYLCVPDSDVVEFIKTEGAELFGGHPDNVEARLIECALQFKIDVFHHIDGDDPFFSREMVIESMQCFLRGKFARIPGTGKSHDAIPGAALADFLA